MSTVMKLPKIYTYFRQGQVFTIDEVRCKLGINGNTLRKRLSDLIRQGYVFHIRQGLYRLSHTGESRFNVYHTSSPYEIAAKLTPYCYLGYKTALQFHAKQKIPNNDKLYIISPTKFNHFQFDYRTYLWCQSIEFYGIEEQHYHDGQNEFKIHVTDLEKSLIDCLKRPSYCPKFSELIDLCNLFSTPPDFEKLILYAKKINVRSVFNRLGYFLEFQGQTWNINENILTEIESHICQKYIEWSIFSTDINNARWKIR